MTRRDRGAGGPECASWPRALGTSFQTLKWDACYSSIKGRFEDTTKKWIAFISCGRCSKLPQTRWQTSRLKAAEIWFLSSGGQKSEVGDLGLKSRCQQGRACPGGSVAGRLRAPSAFGAPPGTASVPRLHRPVSPSPPLWLPSPLVPVPPAPRLRHLGLRSRPPR